MSVLHCSFQRSPFLLDVLVTAVTAGVDTCEDRKYRSFVPCMDCSYIKEMGAFGRLQQLFTILLARSSAKKGVSSQTIK